MESCGPFCITEKRLWKKAPQTEPPQESATAGGPHQDYIGASLDREALSLNPFTYTARETAEAGLMYYRARYLSTGIGRFISEDPLGFEALSMNFYPYVDNDPARWIDPYGLIKHDRSREIERECNENDRTYCKVFVCRERKLLNCYVSWVKRVREVDGEGNPIVKLEKTSKTAIVKMIPSAIAIPVHVLPAV